jgi:hypothetical protein
MPGWATSSDVKQMLQEFPNQGDLRPRLIEKPSRIALMRCDLSRWWPRSVRFYRSPFPCCAPITRSTNRLDSMTLIAIAMRPDSAELLGPDIPELVYRFTQR